MATAVQIEDGVGGSRNIAEVTASRELVVTGTFTASGTTTVVQPTHDDLNANANIQVEDVDVTDTNQLPVKELQLVDSGNSSTALLGNGGTFTGTGRLLDGYESVTVQTFSDVPGTVLASLRVQFSTDNVNWDVSYDYITVALTALETFLPSQARYMRVVYNNSLVFAQGVFRLQTILHPKVLGSNLMVEGVQVSDSRGLAVKNQTGQSLDVDITSQSVDLEVVQSTHDDLNANANLQIGDVDVSGTNQVPTKELQVVDAGNSSTTPLGISGTFTGTGVSVLCYQSITVEVLADQPSDLSPLGLRVEWSQDNTNWDLLESYDIQASTAALVTIPVRGEFLRVVYHNNFSIAQTIFRLQTTLHPKALTTGLIIDGRELSEFGPNGGLGIRNIANNSLAVTTLTGVHVDTDDQHDLIVAETPDDMTGLKMAGFERDDNLDNGWPVAGDGDAVWGKLDSRGALWVRISENKMLLSGSTDGRPVAVVAVASAGTLIHTADATATDLIWLKATNTTAAEVTLTLEMGGTTAADQVVLRIPAFDTRQILTGEPLTNSLILRAFGSVASAINVSGFVKREP